MKFIIILTVLAVLLVFVFLYIKKEKFCGSCQGIGIKSYPKKEIIRQLYNEGLVTEFTIPQNQPPNNLNEYDWNRFKHYSTKQKQC